MGRLRPGKRWRMSRVMWRGVWWYGIAALFLVACGTPLATQHHGTVVPFGRPRPTETTLVATPDALAEATSPVAATDALASTPTTVVENGTASGGEAISPTGVVVELTPTSSASSVIDGTAGAIVPTSESASEAATTVEIVPAAPPTPSNNQRWRDQEVNRQPFPTPVTYTTTGSDLMWYDPVFQQSVLLGNFRGNFDALATFNLRGSDQPALEVLYEVNNRYGLTALSPAIVERIKAAGYDNGFVDTYVILDSRVQPK